MKLYQRPFPKIDLDNLKCREGVFEWQDVLKRLYSIDKNWILKGLITFLVFFVYLMLSIIAGFRNIDVKRSETDFRYKIYYSFFLYPRIENQNLTCTEITRNLFIFIYFSVLFLNKFHFSHSYDGHQIHSHDISTGRISRSLPTSEISSKFFARTVNLLTRNRDTLLEFFTTSLN